MCVTVWCGWVDCFGYYFEIIILFLKLRLGTSQIHEAPQENYIQNIHNIMHYIKKILHFIILKDSFSRGHHDDLWV